MLSEVGGQTNAFRTGGESSSFLLLLVRHLLLEAMHLFLVASCYYCEEWKLLSLAHRFCLDLLETVASTRYSATPNLAMAWPHTLAADEVVAEVNNEVIITHDPDWDPMGFKQVGFGRCVVLLLLVCEMGVQ